MTEYSGEIKIWYPLKHADGGVLWGQAVRIFPVSRWIIYLILAPTFIALAFFSAFLFSIFFPLFLFGGITVGLWIWWLRRKLRKSNPAQSLEGEYVVIKETHIVETKTGKVGDK